MQNLWKIIGGQVKKSRNCIQETVKQEIKKLHNSQESSACGPGLLRTEVKNTQKVMQMYTCHLSRPLNVAAQENKGVLCCQSFSLMDYKLWSGGKSFHQQNVLWSRGESEDGRCCWCDTSWSCESCPQAVAVMRLSLRAFPSLVCECSQSIRPVGYIDPGRCYFSFFYFALDDGETQRFMTP